MAASKMTTSMTSSVNVSIIAGPQDIYGPFPAQSEAAPSHRLAFSWMLRIATAKISKLVDLESSCSAKTRDKKTSNSKKSDHELDAFFEFRLFEFKLF